MPITDMIKDGAVAAVISNPRLPDNPIIDCNDAFIALTGYSREEIVGRYCRLLPGEGTEPWLIETLRTGIREKRPIMVEILNYKKTGQPFRNAVLVAPMFDAAGELEYFLGSQMEIAETDAAGTRGAAARAKVEALSSRQHTVLLAITKGKLNKQIAYDLGLSERTVKMHRSAMLKALDVHSTAEAVRLAIEAGY
ncbi:MAG: hypothetical protein NVS3B27_01640 [Novosphingobium sp.]